MIRSLAALATVSVLALGAAAGSVPEPVAQIDALSARQTEVKLAGGFVDALGTLKLTPAPVGGGEITRQGVARFPITGGTVTYYKPGTVAPFVQGEIDHDAAGSASPEAGEPSS